MILQLQNIVGGYAQGHDILQGIDLDVKAGEAVAIIGLNGSGKSTLGKAIMNMLPFRTGALLFNNCDITRCTTSQLSNHGISIFMQGGQVFDMLSVWENLRLAAGNDLSAIEDMRRYFELLGGTKKKLSGIKADKLSGGERHQLALAMSILNKPSLMILDEPSAGLSPVAAKVLYEVLTKIRVDRKLSIILIEQNIALANEFCDRMCLIEQGKINSIIFNKDIISIETLMFKQ